ncbi:MAG: hypothetical protein JRJ56_07465 [Deltaproteobacteria bacterium]|nr:hypothetical protein [Deltaproteobacteria bacterium]
MSNKEIFLLTKSYYKTALDNFELYQKNSEKMLKIFLDQYGDLNSDFMKNYEEWMANSHKAFDDYRKLILDGLDYLADTFDK